MNWYGTVVALIVAAGCGRSASSAAAVPVANASLNVHYAEAATWVGALDVAALTRESDLEQRLIRKFDFLQTREGDRHISREAHVDFSIFGAIPLELYRRTNAAAYLALGQSFADRQWANPTPNGMSREARYWADDMYMMTLLQVEAYRATGNRLYLDRIAFAMKAYLDGLQQPNGLFYHGAGSPFYWARGNGWAAAGMTELLRSLPADHPRRAAIMTSYRKMMATLLREQAPSGLVERAGHRQRPRGAVSLLRRASEEHWRSAWPGADVVGGGRAAAVVQEWGDGFAVRDDDARASLGAPATKPTSLEMTITSTALVRGSTFGAARWNTVFLLWQRR